MPDCFGQVGFAFDCAAYRTVSQLICTYIPGCFYLSGCFYFYYQEVLFFVCLFVCCCYFLFAVVVIKCFMIGVNV